MAQSARLFDLDGTLVATRSAYAAALSSHGAMSAAEAMRSLANGASIATLLHESRISRPVALSEMRRAGFAPYDGAVDAVLQLAGGGCALGVVTSLPGWLAEAVIDAIGLTATLAAVVHASNCRFRKPSPRPLLAALAGLGVQPDHDNIYVGDSEVDARAARAAGLRFAWASWGYGRPVLQPGDISLREPRDLLAQ